MKNELNQLIKKQGETYGTYHGVTVLENPYPLCNPDSDHIWQAEGCKIVDDMLVIVDVNWDFSGVEDIDLITDYVFDLPWEDEKYIVIDHDGVDSYDLLTERGMAMAIEDISSF